MNEIRETQNRETLQEIDLIWDQLVTLSESRKYYYRFHGVQYKSDPKKAWKYKIMAIRRLDWMLMEFRSYQLKKALMEVIKMEPEIMLICWDVPKNQKLKIMALLQNCRNKLNDILWKEKHPNTVKIEDKRTVNMLPECRKIIMLNSVL